MQPLFKKLETGFRRLLVLETAHLGLSRRLFVYLPRILSFAGIQFGRDSASTMAAALAYTTLLSAVPVIALTVLYTKIAGKMDDYTVGIQAWVFRSFVAESAQGITAYIDRFVDNLHTKALGAVGILGLLFTAYSLLASIEKSLNRIWKVQRHRTVLGRFQMLCSLLIVVPSFLTASFYVSGKIHVVADAGLTLFVLPFFFTAASLFFIFKAVPHTFVRVRSAAAAAAVAAVLFEAGKTGFNFYVTRLVSLDKVYGSLGLLPVILIWVYLSWMIILFGAEIAYCSQNLSLLQKEAAEKDREGLRGWVHDEWGVRIVEAVAKLFRKRGGPVPLCDILLAVPLDQETIRAHLGVLAREGWIAELDGEDDCRIVFTRPFDQIRVADVRNAFRKHLNLPALKARRGEDTATIGAP